MGFGNPSGRKLKSAFRIRRGNRFDEAGIDTRLFVQTAHDKHNFYDTAKRDHGDMSN